MPGRIMLEAAGIELDEGGKTVWIHGPHGTVLRIQCTGKIIVNSCSAPGPHADVRVQGDITFCVPDLEDGTKEEGSDVHQD